LILICCGYYIKQTYYYSGHEYTGNWIANSDRNHTMSITHEGNHFIITKKDTNIISKQTYTKIWSATINKNEQLEFKDEKVSTLTHLQADDSLIISGYSLYYKRL